QCVGEENNVGIDVMHSTGPAEAIRRFIARDILFVEGELLYRDNDSFIENGIVDSTGILELQLFVEETFGFEVQNEDLIPENFDSISRLARYVAARSGFSP